MAAAAATTAAAALMQVIHQADTDGIIAALRDAIAESEALIGGERDEACHNEYRATRRRLLELGAARGTPARGHGAAEPPTDTAAQCAELASGRLRLTQELEEMDWMWLRRADTVSEDHCMLRAVCAAEMELQDTAGPWQQDGHSGLAAAFRRLIVAAAGARNFKKPDSGAAKTSGFGGLVDDVVSVIGQHQTFGMSGLKRGRTRPGTRVCLV